MYKNVFKNLCPFGWAYHVASPISDQLRDSLPAPGAVARELIPPVPQHPAVKVGDLGRRAGQHDERVLARGRPVVKVVQTERVAL